MKNNLLCQIIIILGFILGQNALLAATTNSIDIEQSMKSAMAHLNMLALEENIGLRSAGTEQEKQTADYIKEQFEALGIKASLQAFPAKGRRGDFGTSHNVVAYIPAAGNPEKAKTLVIGAHYDTLAAPTRSLGAVDNAASIAVLLSTAKNFQKYSVDKANNNINLLFIAFGAEEVGLLGSRYFVANHLEASADYLGMINLDSMVGGDNLYVHSPLSRGYNCGSEDIKSNNSTVIRDALLTASKATLGSDGYQLHKAYENYPEGETGQWSDHAPFACSGIAVAQLEATNFDIVGRNGNDGYSNTVNPELWDCFDPKTLGSCDRDKERKWGMIWHRPADRLDVLNQLFPGRIETQMKAGIVVLSELLINSDHYL